MSGRLSVKERRLRDLKAHLDSRKFYELCQQYRHALAVHQREVIHAFEAVKADIIALIEKLK